MSLIFIFTLAVQAGLIVHVFKTGRNTLWIWAIALLPAAGSLAYIAVEILLATGAVVAVHLVSLPTALVVDLVGGGALVVAGLATGALTPDPGARA